MKPKESYRFVWLDFSEYEGMKRFHKPLLLTIQAGMSPSVNRQHSYLYNIVRHRLKSYLRGTQL